MLAQRVQHVLQGEEFLLKYLYEAQSDEFDPKTNRNGYINFGTSINKLNEEEILKKLNADGIRLEYKKDCQKYYKTYGTDEIRIATANFLTKIFHATQPVKPENLFFVSGVTTCIDLLAHCLADPGDVILCPVPVYARIQADMKLRALVDLWPIELTSELRSTDTETFHLTLTRVEEAYNKAIKAKKNVRGIILVNPSNPLGDVYDSKLLLDIMHFCKQHELHLICDEIYGLTVFDKQRKFQSVLSIPNIPDPQRVHMIYGLSKDIGLPGLRLGVIHTELRSLHHCLKELSFFHIIPLPVMQTVTQLLTDIGWCVKHFSELSPQLQAAYSYSKQRIEAMGLSVRPAKAGVFLWVDFRKKLQPLSFEGEMQLFRRALQEFRIFIVPGGALFSPEPGWFRMIFALERAYIDEGLSRLERLLQAIEAERSDKNPL